jgi:hypothetical protein
MARGILDELRDNEEGRKDDSPELARKGARPFASLHAIGS